MPSTVMASIPMTDALLDSASEAEDSSGVDTVSGDEGLEVLHVSGPAAVDATDFQGFSFLWLRNTLCER